VHGQEEYKMTDQEKLYFLEKRIKEISEDKHHLMDMVLSDVGEEAFYFGEFTHELIPTIDSLRLSTNALMTERRLLRESLGYDIIIEEE
jgi:hypothetical protein